MENYKAIRAPLNIQWPGYMIHESAMWSDHHNRWFFLPRRCSQEKYNETRDEMMGCNVLISASEDFASVYMTKVCFVAHNRLYNVTYTMATFVCTQLDNYSPSHGFSSFKFVPGSDDTIIVALQTEELNGRTATFITAFTVDGRTILSPQKIPTDLKYEGFEFI